MWRRLWCKKRQEPHLEGARQVPEQIWLRWVLYEDTDRLKRSGLNAHTRDSGGRSLLHWSVYWNKKKTTRWLLSAFPELIHAQDQEGATPLWTAIQRGHTESLRLLVQQGGVDPNRPHATQAILPIMHAMHKGRLSVVAALCDLGVCLSQTLGETTVWGFVVRLRRRPERQAWLQWLLAHPDPKLQALRLNDERLLQHLARHNDASSMRLLLRHHQPFPHHLKGFPPSFCHFFQEEATQQHTSEVIVLMALHHQDRSLFSWLPAEVLEGIVRALLPVHLNDRTLHAFVTRCVQYVRKALLQEQLHTQPSGACEASAPTPAQPLCFRTTPRTTPTLEAVAIGPPSEGPSRTCTTG